MAQVWVANETSVILDNNIILWHPAELLGFIIEWTLSVTRPGKGHSYTATCTQDDIWWV